MTLSTTTVRTSFAGSGSTGPFSFAFKITAASDLDVYKTTAAGGTSTLAYPSDYTVAGAGDAAGGSVTLTTALAVGESLAIVRDVPATQPTSLRTQGTFLPESHEDALDRLAMVDQQLVDGLARAIQLPASVDPSSAVLQLTRETGKVIGWNAGGITNLTLDSGAIAIPGGGRTVSTLTAYIANNAVFNPLDYGADASGVVDASSAIQAAITAAAAVKGVVVIPAGTYKLTRQTGVLSGMSGGVLGASLQLASNVTIRMDPGASLVQSSANTDAFYGNNLFDVALINVVVTGKGGSDQGNAFELFGIGRLHIEGCKISSIGEGAGVGGGGIVLTGCDQVRVVANNGIDCGYAMVNIFHCTNFVVAQNIHANTRGTSAGPVTCVYVGGSSGGSASTDGVVIGNVALNNNYSFQMRVNCSRVAWVGNVAKGELGVGITVQSSTSNPVTDVSVVGNTIEVATGGVGGINFDGTQYCTCEGNTVEGPATTALIYVNVTGTIQPIQVTVRGNTVRGAATNGFGILVSAGTGVIVADNQVNCSSSGQRSVSITGGSSHVVSGNVVIAANFHAIDNTATDCLITGNYIDGTTNTGDGIKSSGSGCQVTNNMARSTIAGTAFNVSGSGSSQRDNSRSTGARSGRAVLVAGTVTVSTAEVLAADNILLTRVVTGGTVGHLSVGTITAGTSFVINSGSATDTSTIFWEIVH